jgi:hypothetical protein
MIYCQVPDNFFFEPNSTFIGKSEKTYIMTSHGGKMIITNIETLPGKTIVEHFGLVSGSTIRAKHIGRDFMAGLKNIVGGELKGYTQLLKFSCDGHVAKVCCSG